MKNLISRRFSINVINNHDFSLKINSEIVDLSQHFYDDNLEFVYYFGTEFTKKSNNASLMFQKKNFFTKEDDVISLLIIQLVDGSGTVKFPSQFTLLMKL